MNNEPVAWMNPSQVLHGVIDARTYRLEGFIPLYTHPSEHDLGIAEAIGFDKGYKAATAKTQEPDCYGDGNVYRGVRSKDSEIQTIHIDSIEKTLTDEEIHQIFRDETGFEIDTCPIAILDFARAILRKAQEK